MSKTLAEELYSHADSLLILAQALDGEPAGGLEPGELASAVFLQARTARTLRKLAARVERMEAALRDFADHGLRCDLTPTIAVSGMAQMYAQLSGMLRCADEYVREKASAALDRPKEQTENPGT